VLPNTDLGAVSFPAPAPKADVVVVVVDGRNENGPFPLPAPVPAPIAGGLNPNNGAGVPLGVVVVVFIGSFFSTTGVALAAVPGAKAPVAGTEGGVLVVVDEAGCFPKLNENLGVVVVVVPDGTAVEPVIAGVVVVAGGNTLAVALGNMLLPPLLVVVVGADAGLGNENSGVCPTLLVPCCCCCSLVPAAATTGAGGPTLDGNEMVGAGTGAGTGAEARVEGNAVAVEVEVDGVVVVVALAPEGFPNENPVVVVAAAGGAEGGCVTPNVKEPPTVVAGLGSAGFAKKLGIALVVVEAAVVVAGVGAVGAPEDNDEDSEGLVGFAKKSTAPPVVVVSDGVGVVPVEGAVTEIAGTLVTAAALACLSFSFSFLSFSAFSNLSLSLSLSLSFSLSFSFSASFLLFASLTFIIALASNSCFSHFEKAFAGGVAGLLPDPITTLVLSDSPAGDSGLMVIPLIEPERLVLPVRLNAREVDDILLTVVIVDDVPLLPLFQAIGNPTVVAIECLYEGCALLGIIGSS